MNEIVLEHHTADVGFVIGLMSAKIFDDLAGCVLARTAGQSGAGVSAGPAQVKTCDRSTVAGVPQQRAHGEKLLERQLAMIDVAAGGSIGGFDVGGRYYLLLKDTIRQVRRVCR